MLDHKVIIYDDSCPLCKVYTYWFVAWGFLAPANRVGFAKVSEEIRGKMDLNRGRHEIPLFDKKTGQTIYGLEALAFILGSKWTWLQPFFRSAAFYWMFYPLYQIITYNRRVIAGCAAACGYDCAPDLNRFYRSVYLLLAGGFVAMTALKLMSVDSMAVNAAAASALLGGLAVVGIIVTAVMRISVDQLAAWNYAGNYATTTLIVAIFLAPVWLWPTAGFTLQTMMIATAALIGLSEMRRRGL